MTTWLKDNGPVIGALAGVVVAFVAALQFVVVGPMNRGFDDLRAEMNARFGDVNLRIDDLRDDMNKRFEAVNERLDSLTGEVSELRKLTVSITERVSRNEAQIDLITERLQPAPTQGP